MDGKILNGFDVKTVSLSTGAMLVALFIYSQIAPMDKALSISIAQILTRLDAIDNRLNRFDTDQASFITKDKLDDKLDAVYKDQSRLEIRITHLERWKKTNATQSYYQDLRA